MAKRPAKSETVTVGDWLITLLIGAIPLVNLIMLCVWAFGGGTPPSKANFAKATLLWLVLSVLLSVLLYLVMGLSVLALFATAGSQAGGG